MISVAHRRQATLGDVLKRCGSMRSLQGVAKRFGMDATRLAHHLALLTLPTVLDEAMTTGRGASPRTLHELNKWHAGQPERIAEMVVNSNPSRGMLWPAFAMN